MTPHEGREAGVRAGRKPPGRIPYGYKMAVVIDPEKAEVVREIFRLFWEGWSYERLAEDLNERGVPSPNGRRWRREMIRWLISNESYTGIAKYGTARRKSREAIIPSIQFYRVQKIVQARGAPPAGVGRRAAVWQAKRKLNKRGAQS